jgi:hypothetical protein
LQFGRCCGGTGSIITVLLRRLRTPGMMIVDGHDGGETLTERVDKVLHDAIVFGHVLRQTMSTVVVCVAAAAAGCNVTHRQQTTRIGNFRGTTTATNRNTVWPMICCGYST